MTIIVPNVGEIAIARRFLNQALTLKLFSNNVIPSESDDSNTYVEVSGGGYVAKSLDYNTWVISSNAVCTYPSQDFSFTAATDSPGTVFGYYIIDPNGTPLWAERFPTTILPFVPLNDTLIQVTPRIQVT